MFWATYEQQGNTIALWADEHTDRTIDLIVWHGEIPVTWFQAFNPFMIFTFTPFIIKFWAWQEKRGIELLLRGPLLSDHGGRGMVGGRQFGELVVAVRPLRRHHHRRVLSLPHRVIARFEDRAGAHDLDDDGPVAGTSFIGNFVAGWLGSFWSSMDKISFFIMIAAVAASAGGVIWSFNRPLKGILQG